MTKKKLVFEDFFSSEHMSFEDKDGKEIIRPFVYCKNTSDFIEKLADCR